MRTRLARRPSWGRTASTSTCTKNPIALAVGGVAAVLLEFADARIRSGVWDHSTYKVDPIGRSKRTGVAAMRSGSMARRPRPGG